MKLTASLISEPNLELLFSVHCRALKSLVRLSHDLSYLRCGSNSVPQKCRYPSADRAYVANHTPREAHVLGECWGVAELD